MEIMKNYSHKVWKNEKFSLTEEKNSSNQLLSNFFSKTIAFTIFLQKKLWDTLWKLQKFTLISPKKKSSNKLFSDFFSESVTFTKFLLKKSESNFP